MSLSSWVANWVVLGLGVLKVTALVIAVVCGVTIFVFWRKKQRARRSNGEGG